MEERAAGAAPLLLPGAAPDAADKADRVASVTQRRRSGDTDMSAPRRSRHARTAETARPLHQSRVTARISVDGPGSLVCHV